MKEQQFTCPYCNGELPAPSRKRVCPHCKRLIYARTRPGGKKVWLEEEGVAVFEKEWELHRKQQIFVREASESQNFIYNGFDKLEAKAKQAFKQGNRDEAWSFHNQAILKAGEKFSDINWAARFRTVYAAMACQLAAEERYRESLPFFTKEIYWACFEESLREINYQRAINFDKSKKQEINFSLDAERTLPPFILEPIIVAIGLASVSFDEFAGIFSKEVVAEQQLATKLIRAHEEVKFEAPQPDTFWKIISNVIRDNLEIKSGA